MADKFPVDPALRSTYQAFELLVAQKDSAIDLAQAALLIASVEYPDLDSAKYRTRLADLAQRVRTLLELPVGDGMEGLPEGIDLGAVVQAMNQVLFVEEGFHGNRADYNNPDNSFFNRVLDERTGIPISLALLYIEVGKRVGLEVAGIGLPFHFMVRCYLAEEPIYLDVFDRGRILNEHACRERVRRLGEHITGEKILFRPHWFVPLSHRQFLYRMLNNLKHLYLHTEDYIRALKICDLMILLVPSMASEWRDRGLLHLQLKRYARALRDLMKYTELAPEADDRLEMVKHIKAIRQVMAMMN